MLILSFYFQIDVYVINAIDDVSLSKYLPIYGDRIALYNFCKIGKTSKKKNPGLFEKLKTRMQLQTTTEENCEDDRDDDSEDTKSSNALKRQRRIQIGWIHRTGRSSFSQVLTRDGGGPRKVIVDKGAVKNDIMEFAKAKFFPKGVSAKGPTENFIFDIWDFARNKMPDSVTVGETYQLTGLSSLRYYLYTEEKKEKKHENSKGKKLKLCNDNSLTKRIQHHDDSDNVLSDGLPEMKYTRRNYIEEKKVTTSSPKEFVESEPPMMDILRMAAIESNIIDEYQNDDTDNDIQFSPFDGSSFTDLNETIPELFHDAIQPRLVNLVDAEQAALTSELPMKMVNDYHCKLVKVYRGQVLQSLLDFFQKDENDPNNFILSIEMILPNGKTEAAEDNGGVLRDCLSEFWKDFYQQCTTGTSNKLPFLRHDFEEKRWKAVAKIIVIGWEQEGYFPIQISKAFMEQCIYGKTTISLIDAFLCTVSPTDKEVLNRALTEFDSVDTDDLLDILENFDCKSLPNSQNILEIISQLAHKAIIQEPNFVIDSWNSIFSMRLSKNLSKEHFDTTYQKLVPTPKKVINIIRYPTDMDVLQSTVSKHLQRFIKDLDNNSLSDFLRFVTGSDLMIKDCISVRFVDLQGIARRPIAHTCGCVLELPKVYANYPDFKTEFLSVLQSSVWVMDII